jgi:hypothetical protein
VSEISGTTTEAQAFSLSLSGEAQYTLFDTPGFQRPRQVLAWLENHAANASERVNAVKQFLDEFVTEPGGKFHDEVELLSPIIDGAGIIYVVDGSKPYSPEFEAEMTILQWTSQPRMAMINPIGGEAYVEEWRSALSQYFNIVRVFDPMTADARKQESVLSAFSELHEPWRADLERTLNALNNYRKQLRSQGAYIVVENWLAAMSHKEMLKVPASFAKNALEQQLRQRYQQSLQDIEARMRRDLQSLFAHTQLRTDMDSLDANIPDLFDKSSWYMFGLDRQKIIALSTSAGAAAGVVIDVGLGGASLMAGAVAGGLVSGAASFAATLKPEKLKIKGVPMAGEMLTAGPVSNLAFGFILLGRAIDFFDTITLRTHGDRREVTVKTTRFDERLERLSKSDQVRLTRLVQKAHKGLSDNDLLQLRGWVQALSSNASGG